MPVFLNPIRRAFHWLGGKATAMDASVFSPFDELGAFEHAQMLRDGGKRHFIGAARSLMDGFPLREAREDAAARRVGKRGKSGIERKIE